LRAGSERTIKINGGQRWSLSAIHGLRDTGASWHNGIEPPTRGFSIRGVRALIIGQIYYVNPKAYSIQIVKGL